MHDRSWLTFAGLLLALLAGRSASGQAAVPEPPSHEVRVAVLGDATAMPGDPARPFDDWPSQLGRMLGERSEVVNCSRGGTRLDPETARFVVKLPEFRKAEDARAGVVLLALGSSDCLIVDGADPVRLRAGLDAIVAALEPFRPEPRVFVCIPPPFPSEGRRGPMFLDALDRTAPILAAFAAARGFGVIDFREPFLDRRDLLGEAFAPGGEASTLMAAQAYRAIVGSDPQAGTGPYRESFDPASMVRRELVSDGKPLVPAEGWTAGEGDAAGFLASGESGTPLLLEGAIPEGPFRMRWRLRWTPGPTMAEKGGPQLVVAGNSLQFDNRNASMALFGSDVRGTPTMPATERTVPRDTMLEVEIRRSQGVLEWRVDGRTLHRVACPPKAMAGVGLHPMGGRVELAAWTLDLPAK